MWTVIGTALVPFLKWIFEKMAKKKLNDKEFVEYVVAHQKKRARAGQAAVDWETALKQAQDELAAEEVTKTEQEIL